MAQELKVWIDQDLCTGDGLCEEIAGDVFELKDDGLAYVKEGGEFVGDEKGMLIGTIGENAVNALAIVPEGQEDIVREARDECPGECIFIEVDGVNEPVG